MFFGSKQLNVGFLRAGCLLIVLLWPAGLTLAGEKVEYKDIYLTEDRVCKACRAEWLDDKKVRLVNRAGFASIVPVKVVIGIDRHPFVRKTLMKSLHGIGLPGPILVPAAFEDANDYVCKYCDSFNK